MQQRDGAWSQAVRAQVLQGLTLALSSDVTWQALYCAALSDADKVRPELERYGHALRALGNAMEAFDKPVLAGRTGFLVRSRAVRGTLGKLAPAWLPGPVRSAVARSAAGLHSLLGQPSSDDLRACLFACMGWQEALCAAASTLPADELPRLWFDYALERKDWHGPDPRRLFWRLAIVGGDLLTEASRSIVDPARYDGAVIACLRRGDSADAVCARFHLDQQPFLEEWVDRVAVRLREGHRLQRDDALPRW